MSSCPVSGKSSEPSNEGGSGCPMKGNAKPAPAAPVAAAPDACPMSANNKGKDGYKNPEVYNVYNQRIDPKNQMPTTANQALAPGQRDPLPTEREPSSIPKGGTDSTWLYPSPQMFWNALVRKDKTEGVAEHDIPSVIRIHNNMNERTWKQVLKWEDLRPSTGEGKDPKLLRFLGRPDELSPKAQLKVWLGHAAPFDRHDWFVDRGGKEVRYVIDYYHDEAGASADKTPSHMGDFSSIRSILLDVRPALDSFDAVVDRAIKMPWQRFLGKTDFKPLPFMPAKDTLSAELQFVDTMKRTFSAVQASCVREKDLLVACQGETDCINASIALQHCSAKVICPQRAGEFAAAISALPHDQKRTEVAFESMVKCLELFEIDLKKAVGKK